MCRHLEFADAGVEYLILFLSVIRTRLPNGLKAGILCCTNFNIATERYFEFDVSVFYDN